MTVPRIAIPQPAELDAETASLLELTAAPGRRPAGTVAVLAYNEGLVKAFLGWAAALALNGALSRRDHELLALRAAHNCCSEFEWAEHVEYAVSAGLTDDEIQRIRKGPHAAGWSPAEAALLTAADELHTEQRISDQTWAVLTPTYSPAALVELVYVVGQYTMLSMVAETFGVRP